VLLSFVWFRREQSDYFADLRQLRAKMQRQWSQDLTQLETLASASNWNQENAGALSNNSSSSSLVPSTAASTAADRAALSPSSQETAAQLMQSLPAHEASLLADVLAETSSELEATRESIARLKGRLVALRGSPFSPSTRENGHGNEGDSSSGNAGDHFESSNTKIVSFQSPSRGPRSRHQQQQPSPSPRYSSSGYLAASASPAGESSARSPPFGGYAPRASPSNRSEQAISNTGGLSDLSSLSKAMDVIMSID